MSAKAEIVASVVDGDVVDTFHVRGKPAHALLELIKAGWHRRYVLESQIEIDYFHFVEAGE